MSDTVFPLVRRSGVSRPGDSHSRTASVGVRVSSGRGRFSRPVQAGFTVLELVVVMVVIGILSVVVLPRLNVLDGFDQLGYRDRVRATLEYARKSAVAQRRNVRVQIASSVTTVTVEQATPEGDVGTPGSYAALNLPGSNTNTFNPPSGVTLTPPNVTLTFDPLGKPSAAATLTVSGSGNITVEAETGYVH